MTQLKYFIPEEDPFNCKIQDKKELINVFSEFQKPKNSFLIGVEHERFIVEVKSLRPIGFFGMRGMENFLKQLKKELYLNSLRHYQYVIESNRIIGLQGNNNAIALEPGGQLELSGQAFISVNEIYKEMLFFDIAVSNVCKKLGFKSLFLGYHPSAKINNFAMVPKNRYKIMKNFLSESKSLDMMLRTCSLQINIDYDSENSFIEHYRLSLLLLPVIVFLCNNSNFIENINRGYFSRRLFVWRNVDYNRCGIPKFVFNDDFSYEKYIDNVIKVPMMFLVKKNKYIQMPKMTFSEYMYKGFNGNVATIRDFINHLSGVFWEVRAKPQIEIRSADVGSISINCALAAFIKGLIYNKLKHKRLKFIFNSIMPDNVESLYLFSFTKNSTLFSDDFLINIVYECLNISKEFLEKTKEAHFLEPFFKKIDLLL